MKRKGEVKDEGNEESSIFCVSEGSIAGGLPDGEGKGNGGVGGGSEEL